MELTEAQERHLRVLLDHIEAAVNEVVRLAEQPPLSRRLSLDVPDLPLDFPSDIEPAIEQVRRTIESLASMFALEPVHRSRARRAQALLVAATIELEDAGSRGLRSYGPVEPGLAQRVDPLLDDLSSALRSALAALRLPPQ